MARATTSTSTKLLDKETSVAEKVSVTKEKEQKLNTKTTTSFPAKPMSVSSAQKVTTLHTKSKGKGKNSGLNDLLETLSSSNSNMNFNVRNDTPYKEKTWDIPSSTLKRQGGNLVATISTAALNEKIEQLKYADTHA